MLLKPAYRLDQVGQGAAEAIQLPDDQHVAVAHVVERLAEPGAIGPGARRAVLERLRTAGCPECVQLQRWILVMGADARVANVGHPMSSVFPSGNHLVRFLVVVPEFSDTAEVADHRSFAGQPPVASFQPEGRIRMARRRLFSDEHWAGLFALPADERDILRHCTLTPDDLALIGVKRSAHNRLGYALLLCALRHPGRVLDAGEVPPVPMVAYVAGQLGVDPATFAAYSGRPQTRREQLSELMRRGGFRSFGWAEARALVAWLGPMAQTGRRSAQLAGMLIDELRRQRILLPTPRVLELVIHHACARAERVTHRALLEGMAPEQAAALDRMLTPLSERGGTSTLAWLRQAPDSPAARNLVGLVERLRTVRAARAGPGPRGRGAICRVRRACR